MNYMSMVIFFACLDLEQKFLFMNKHQFSYIFTKIQQDPLLKVRLLFLVPRAHTCPP
jgi:hypothetical protein